MVKTIRIYAAPEWVNGEWKWDGRPIAELAEPPEWVYKEIFIPPVSNRFRTYSSREHKALFEPTRSQYLFAERIFEVLHLLYAAQRNSENKGFLAEFSS